MALPIKAQQTSLWALLQVPTTAARWLRGTGFLVRPSPLPSLQRGTRRAIPPATTPLQRRQISRQPSTRPATRHSSCIPSATGMQLRRLAASMSISPMPTQRGRPSTPSSSSHTRRCRQNLQVLHQANHLRHPFRLLLVHQ